MDAAQRRSMLIAAGIVLVVGTAVTVLRDRSNDQLGPELARTAQPGDIRMLSSLSCVFCRQARLWMNEHGVAHSECFIERDAECLNRYRALGAGGTPLVLVRGEPQLGFSPPRVLERLQATAR